MHRHIDRSFDLPAIQGLDGPVRMTTTFHLPQAFDPAQPLLLLFPGAGYSRLYYDLHFEGYEDYSQAEFHAGRGQICVAIDHLGSGDSAYAGSITLEQAAATSDGIVKAIIAALAAGTVDPALPAWSPSTLIGMGQSMGGHVVVATQADYATFDALAILGSSFTQTRLTLKPGCRYPLRDATPERLMQGIMTETDMMGGFHWPDEPADLIARDTDEATAPWRTNPPPYVLTGRPLLPNAYAREAGAVRVPTLLVYGEMDVTPDPSQDLAMFRAATDIALRIFPEMAHMHNFAPTRRRLWVLLDAFARRIAAEQAQG